MVNYNHLESGPLLIKDLYHYDPQLVLWQLLARPQSCVIYQMASSFTIMLRKDDLDPATWIKNHTALSHVLELDSTRSSGIGAEDS